jgi:hypothetical protein
MCWLAYRPSSKLARVELSVCYHLCEGPRLRGQPLRSPRATTFEKQPRNSMFAYCSTPCDRLDRSRGVARRIIGGANRRPSQFHDGALVSRPLHTECTTKCRVHNRLPGLRARHILQRHRHRTRIEPAVQLSDHRHSRPRRELGRPSRRHDVLRHSHERKRFRGGILFRIGGALDVGDRGISGRRL